VKFYYVYKSLAHPETNNYVAPFTIEERLMHVAEAQRVIGSRFTWLCDTMDNEIKQAFGGVPNAEIVFDPDGNVARRRGWSNPDALRDDLEQLVGSVDEPTLVEDLDMPEVEPAKTVAKGIVPRVKVTSRMRALRVEPDLAGAKVPFYVKLRAEGDAGLLESGTGTMYVGFHLDPLYKVHWNNDAKPLKFDIEAPSGVRVTPASVVGPDPEEPADADPREFLLEVDAGEKSGEPLELSVRYFACDDAQTFCVPVTQQYSIRLERDPDGGSVGRTGLVR
jgi:hypothetical protein